MSDLIDRQAAISAVNTALFPKINTAKDAEKALLNLPSAQPERQKGKWIEYPAADGMNQCSECGVLRFGESNYCPNCGADMRGEQNG